MMTKTWRILACCFVVYGISYGGDTAANDAIVPTSLSGTGSHSEGTLGYNTRSSVQDDQIIRTSLANATCPSRTINYITHTQQSLETERLSRITSSSLDKASGSSPSQPITQPGADSEFTAVPHSRSGETLLASPTLPSRSDTAAGENTTAITRPIQTTLEAGVNDETESALDGANFLSFEEWKKQNLEKAGQSPEDLGRGQPVDANRPRPDLSHAFDTLGEESEIDLDFGGFGGGAKPPNADDHKLPSGTTTPSPSDSQASASLTVRSKDAGKTCKERTNYASFDCAATALKSNKECKSVSSILIENKDSYMLNICAADDKFVIVELCDDILIDTIVLANYEFFSSGFRHFRVSVSDRYPVKAEKWRDLGTFEARNTREIQAFLVENPLIWARYLRIEFLTHYGSEYYCPVSLLRVHGTTMLEEFRHQEDINRGEEEEVSVEIDVIDPPAVMIDVNPSTEESPEPAGNIDQARELPSKGTTIEDSMINVTTSHRASTSIPARQIPTSNDMQTPTISVSSATCRSLLSWLNTSCEMTPMSTKALEEIQVVQVVLPSQNRTNLPEVKPLSTVTVETSPRNGDSRNSTTASPTNVSAASSGSAPLQSEKTTSLNAPLPIAPSAQRPSQNDSTLAPLSTTLSPSTISSQMLTNTNLTSSNANRTMSSPSSTIASQQPQPSTQESFFKSVHKRLQQLESNSTLSLKYIEEQSRILRDAFSKVEKRQFSTTTTFLSNLNLTVTTELHGFRQAYNQLWESTVLELEGQRDQAQREMLAHSARLTLLADELVWQKRMGIFQSTLILLCLAIVLFGRFGGGNGHLEAPLMMQMMNRSTAALRSGWESPPASPSPDSRSPENRSPSSLFRRKIWQRSADVNGNGSANLTDSDREGPEFRLDPPTPPGSRGAQVESPRVQGEDERAGSGEFAKESVGCEDSSDEDATALEHHLRKTVSHPG